MAEIIQPRKLARSKVLELFKNKTFLEYSPLFYESQRTIAEVLRLLGIKGRGTINKQFKVFQQNGEYNPDYIKVEWKHKPPQRKILFTHNIILDFIDFNAETSGQKFELTDQERGLILDFMNLPGIDIVMRKKTKDWFNALAKLSVSMIFFITFQEKVGKQTVHLSDPARWIETITMFKDLTKEERDAYARDIQEFNQRAGGQIYQIATKIVNLNMPISLGSTDVYFLVMGATEAATRGGKSIFKMCMRISPDLERRLKMKANRPEIVTTLAEFGIDLPELLSKKR